MRAKDQMSRSRKVTQTRKLSYNFRKERAVKAVAHIPGWRVSPVLGPRGSRSSSLIVSIGTDRPSYNVGDCRRPSFLSHRFPVWNELSSHITSAPSLWHFCSRLKTRLSAVPIPTLCGACEVACVIITFWALLSLTYLQYLSTHLSPNSTWLDSTRHVRLCRASRASRDESVERDEPCCSNMADDEQACTSLVVFMLLHTQILFVSSNKIN